MNYRSALTFKNIGKMIKKRRGELKAGFATRTQLRAHGEDDRWGPGPTCQLHRGRGGVDRRELADGEVSGDETGGYVLRATIQIKWGASHRQRRSGRRPAAASHDGGRR